MFARFCDAHKMFPEHQTDPPCQKDGDTAVGRRAESCREIPLQIAVFPSFRLETLPGWSAYHARVLERVNSFNSVSGHDLHF